MEDTFNFELKIKKVAKHLNLEMVIESEKMEGKKYMESEI